MQDFAAERATMVDTQIRTNDVTHKPLLEALYTVPREAFVPASARALAYMDKELLLRSANGASSARGLMAPMTFGKLAQLAAVSSGDKVLDVGAATGYSTAVFARLARTVVGLECYPSLAEDARKTLTAQGTINATVHTGPLEQGWPADGPYDVIFLGGSVEEIPEAFAAQLAEGGRLIAIIARGASGKAYLYKKVKGEMGGLPMFDANAPQLPGFAKEPGFVF